ncbi:MAG: hypothetical protein O7C59_10080 [Rickettsia endosymbiont of Ixodes persulcatus]|nr:hypothetical protein [Rickettsia endosymbiont of Ixodes persulcatus]
MYNMAVHAQQVLGSTLVAVSISETNDDGMTYPLATAMSSSDSVASCGEDPLWIFLQQVRDALSIALNDEQSIYRQAIKHDRVDGGWGGAGQAEGPEQSEDEC